MILKYNFSNNNSIKFDNRFLDDTDKRIPKLHAEIMRLWSQYNPNSPQESLFAENNATTSFNAEIENLRALIGTPEFSDALDNLLDKLEAAGVDSQYEQVVGDIINQDAQAKMAKAGV